MWIYIPSEFYPSAQELGESNLDLSWRSQLLEQSAMSRSKPLRARSWQNAWKKKDWIKHLFGRILKPLMASRGVELWIASLADIPVSHLVLLEKSLAIKIQDISGQISKDLFKKSSRQSASLKMFPTIYELDLKKSQMTYDNWVIKLRQACLQRQKLVLLIKEKDSSSWPVAVMRIWPTVRTSSSNGTSSKEVKAGNPKQRLEVMIVNWATPTARDWKDNASANIQTNSLLGRQDPQIMKDGTQSQITLNPRFTEWLMGWPVGWTEFELAETEWCLWLRRMRGELLLMECISQKTIN